MLRYWKLVHNGTFEGVIVLHGVSFCRWCACSALSLTTRSVHELTHDNGSFSSSSIRSGPNQAFGMPRSSRRSRTTCRTAFAGTGVKSAPPKRLKRTAFPKQRSRTQGVTQGVTRICNALEPPHCGHFRHQSLLKAAPPVTARHLWNTLTALTRAFIFTTLDTLQCTN